MKTENVIIIIPTYNEAEGIEKTLLELFNIAPSIPNATIQVLVFDSASTDDTQSIIRGLQQRYPQLHLQTESNKTGLGSAYFQAMQYALNILSADIIVEFDADLSHQPKYLAPMLQLMQTNDVVVGSRYVKGGEIPSDWGWHRKLLSIMGNYVARAVLTLKYKDFTSGFRMTRRKALQQALNAKGFLSNQYAYKIHLLWSLHKNRAKIAEYPIAFVDREKGQSKLPANSIRDSLRVVFTLRFYELLRYFKMCMVGLSGMAVQFIIYNVLRQYLPLYNAAQLAVTAAMINNFVLNNRFTFKHRQATTKSNKIKHLSVFLGYSILMVYLQSSWLTLGINYLGAGTLNENMIMIIGMFGSSLLNYLTYSRLVWRAPRQPDNNIA